MRSRIHLDRAPAILQIRDVIRAFLRFTSILHATIPALLRRQRERAIVEIALRQQL